MNESKQSFAIFVRGLPQAQGSARAFTNKRTGQPILVSKTRNVSEWRQAIKTVVSFKWAGAALDGPVALSLIFVLPRPPSAPKRRIFPITRPDADKLGRAVQDALKGVAYTEDSRVIAPAPIKLYGEEPGVAILLQEIDDSSLKAAAEAIHIFYLRHSQRVFDLLSPDLKGA